MANVRRSRGKRPRTRLTTISSASVAGRARSVENTSGVAWRPPTSVAWKAVPQKNIVVVSSAAEPAPTAPARVVLASGAKALLIADRLRGVQISPGA